MAVTLQQILNTAYPPYAATHRHPARAPCFGVQLVGRRWSEMDLLAVAEQIDLLAPRLGAPRC